MAAQCRAKVDKSVPETQALMRAFTDAVATRSLWRQALADLLGQGDAATIQVAASLRPFIADPVPHFHTGPELFLQVLGEGRMLLAGDDVLTMPPGSALVIPRGVAHRETIASAGRPYLNLVVATNGEAMLCHSGGDRLGGQTRVRQQIRVRGAEVPRVVALLDEAGIWWQRHGPAGEVVVRSLIRAALGMMAAVLDAPDQPSVGGLAELALHLVVRHLCDVRLGVGWLADRLGCSPDHLARRYQALTGQRLVHDINRRRIALARELLQDSALQVQEVAVACGYRDPRYFSRVFRALVGRSPRAARGRPAG